MSAHIKLYLLILLIFSLFSLTGCISSTERVINHITSDAGENGNEIRKAYEHFKLKGDPLQMEALLFLLENMDFHNYSEIALFDSNKVKIEFSVHEFEDYSAARTELDSLNSIFGDLTWRSDNRYNDLETISSDLLISTIELAFEAWRNKPWSLKYSFEDFKEYILPYRGSNEPLSSWRPYFLKVFEDLSQKLDDKSDPLEAASVINDSLKKLFTFDPKFYLNPTDQGLEQMLENKLGRCEDMTNFAIYALRANGIAVSSDYTPYWADSGNNHAWNVIILPDGSSVPFMGCEADPGNYSLRNRMAKAYRKTYSIQPNPLLENQIPATAIPPWLGIQNYIDVTGQYTRVCDVEISIAHKLPDSCSFSYICVFNSGEWEAINYSEIVNNKVVFHAMGNNLCYLPATYDNGVLSPIGAPFIVSGENEIHPLSGSNNSSQQKLISVTDKIVENTTDNNVVSFLQEGKKYLLYYWNDEWIPVGEKSAGSNPLIFEQVPENRLYWLVEKDSRKEERIFTYENGEQIWW